MSKKHNPAENKNGSTQWYEVRQNHNFGYKMMFFVLKVFPAAFMRSLAFPVGFFYWAFGKKTRRISKDYLLKLGMVLLSDYDSLAGVKLPVSTFRHIASFALNLVENVQSWAGKFSFKDVNWQDDDVHDLVKNIDSGKGTIIVISHLGNAQMMKGLASMGESGTQRKMDITTISDEKVSKGFNALLNEINSDASMNIINSDDIGPETIILLQEKLEKGESLTTFKDFYSVWYSVTEEAFEKLLFTDEFARVFDDFSDKYAQYMIAQNKVYERMLAFLPIPTNKDMKSLYKTVYDLRKEVRDLKKALAGKEDKKGDNKES